jgi:hypothetical protein
VRHKNAADAALDTAFPQGRPDLDRDVDSLETGICFYGELFHFGASFVF